ncbi:Ldh family oxidoreductase [Carboxylicivirga sediminis]|uniref:Ldh family oxidoreductase n=1 Tax=Carboxylicivirga sediminis TaxID=2006564 RepID=A0A941IVQ8_9BACT|nr:Ldh family oxidoreductase [Carboxylicivirga sediminis]MBR8534178.1 Ldh family oxidoreductase [Carboxylicivirga sediminis]
MKYPAQKVKAFIEASFLAAGSSTEHALLASQALLAADLRGVDSHGIARLSGYIRLWQQQRLNMQPNMNIVHETPSTAVLDGDKGAGLVVAQKAMDIAIEKARVAGSGWVAVKNSNHFGIAGYHAMKALNHDMIGISMTNASALVAPTFSIDRMLGTNPIAVAIPANNEPPFVMDMATTPAANGKLEVCERLNKNIPQGWAQTKEGATTTDNRALKSGGAMLPLGSDREHGSHKGYCLGAWVDIFSAVLSGANYGPWVPPFVSFLSPPPNPVGDGIGHFIGALRIDAFRPADEFKQHMDNWIKAFRKARPIKGQPKVQIPGDQERTIEKERLTTGIPIHSSVMEELDKLSQTLNIKPL